MSGEAWVALAGIIVTGLVSGLTIWFTLGERRSGYRQVLYPKQIEDFIEFITAVRRARHVVANLVWQGEKRVQSLTRIQGEPLLHSLEQVSDAYWKWAGIVPKELGPLAGDLMERFLGLLAIKSGADGRSDCNGQIL